MFANFVIACLLLFSQFGVVQHDAKFHALEAVQTTQAVNTHSDQTPATPKHDANHCTLCHFGKQIADSAVTSVPMPAMLATADAAPVFNRAFTPPSISFSWQSRAPPLFA